MTVDTETILIKLIEELKVEIKQINQTLTSIQINQARLEGKVGDLEFRLEEKTSGLAFGQNTIITKLDAQALGFSGF